MRLCSPGRPNGTTMLTPGERRFRRGLHIVIALLVAITALLVIVAPAPDSPPPTASRAK